jgi:hypothetical protein
MKMKLVTVEVMGIRPILFHAFKIEAISALSKVKSGSAGNDPEEWKRTVLERDDQLYIPASYWHSCLKEGAKYTKAGRGSIQKSFTSGMTMKSEISLLNCFLPKGWQEMTSDQMVTDSSQDVYLDIRGVMNPNSKGRNIRYRIACREGWKTELEFLFDETIVSQSQIKKIVEDSGKIAGVGDGRVLGYGRFKTLSLKITDESI